FTSFKRLNSVYMLQTLAVEKAFVKLHLLMQEIKYDVQGKVDGFWNLRASNSRNLYKIEERFLHAIARAVQVTALQQETKSVHHELSVLKKELKENKKLIKAKQ